MNHFLDIVFSPDLILDKEKNSRRYIEYFFNRISQMFRIGGLPETIPERYLKNYLLCGGFAIITEVNGDLYAFSAGLGGPPDPYYFPTIATIANPGLNFSGSRKIGEECEIIRNDTNLMGVLPLCKKYAAQIVESDISLYRAAINTRALTMISAGSDSVRKGALVFLEDLEKGELGVCADNDLLESIKVHPISGNYSSSYITQLLELRNYWVSCLWQELGINSNHNMKREALNGSETSTNELTLLPLIDDMFVNWSEGIDRVNKHYGTKITIEKASSWEIEEDRITEPEKGGDPDGSGENENPAD